MKKIVLPFICIILIGVCTFKIDVISNYLVNYISGNNHLIIRAGNDYEKKYNFGYVKNVNTFVPYSYGDLLDIIYTTINKGWDSFTFYCPNEYSNCISDVTSISDDELTLTNINNFVHPFNSFTNIKTSIYESGEITLDINYLYNEDEINKINKKIEEILPTLITDEMDDYDKIKTVHDYIINNTKYDIEKNNNKTSRYHSTNAIGPLFEGYATCNGYTDLMAIILNRLDIKNFKVATDLANISSEETGHVWNAVYYDNEYVHLDLTWDDPVGDDDKNYLYHTYFLVNTEKLKKADNGKVKLSDHNFDKNVYSELK